MMQADQTIMIAEKQAFSTIDGCWGGAREGA